jgi:hypothetical protein
LFGGTRPLKSTSLDFGNPLFERLGELRFLEPIRLGQVYMKYTLARNAMIENASENPWVSDNNDRRPLGVC